MLRSSQLALAIALILVALPPPAAADPPLFAEDWESGSDGWVATGLGLDVQCSDTCALHAEPLCCSLGSTMDHDLAVPVSGQTLLRFEFRPESLGGDTDSWVTLALEGANDSTTLQLHTTEGINNGLSFVAGPEIHRSFAYYGVVGEWIAMGIALDLDNDTARGVLFDADGNVSVVSSAFPIGDVDTATLLSIGAISWTSENVVGFDYDDLTLAAWSPPPFPENCANTYVDLADPGVVRPPHVVQLEIDVIGPCAATSWFVWFGDGESTGDFGSPPPVVEHAYASTGWVEVYVEVQLIDGSWSYDWTSLYLDPRALQVAEGRLAPAVLGIESADDGFVVLDQIAQGGELVTAYAWDAAALDVLFYDAEGAPLPDESCSVIGVIVPAVAACEPPVGAAFADVTGTGVDARWTLTYEYLPPG